MSSTFNTLFQRNQPHTEAKTETKPAEEGLYPVLAPDKLLSLPHRKQVIQQIQTLAKTSPAQFQTMYQALIHNFAEFVQLLPNPVIRYYQRDGGILDYALSRAQLGMEMRKEYQFTSAPETENSDPQSAYALWTYALFSATLLYQLGSQIGHYRVHLFNATKQFVAQWQPYGSSMLNQGDFYKYWPVSEQDARQYRTTTSLLARQIMPSEGFAWIASNPTIFNMWLALLNGDPDTAGLFEVLYHVIDNKIIQDVAGKEPVSFDTIFRELAEELDSKEDTSLGEEFLKWLIKGIQDKSISINQKDSLVHKVDAGIFIIHPDVFKKFSEASSKNPNWVVVQQQFNALGFAKKGGQDYHFEKVFGKEGKTTVVSGPIIDDKRGVLMGKKDPGLSQHVKAVAYDLSSALGKTATSELGQTKSGLFGSAKTTKANTPPILETDKYGNVTPKSR